MATLRPGDQGEDVRKLQQSLVENNFYPDSGAANNGVDGIYGPDTEDAVRRFQIMNGLQVDGIAGPETQEALGMNGGDSGSGSGSTLRPGHSGQRVRELQQALVDAGYYPDSSASNNGVDGIYGSNTEDAVRRYQIMHGLAVDGIAGSETLASLGLSGGSGGSGNTLRPGDQGEAVRELQQSLVDNNFYPDINAPDYGVDGIYGPDTEDAVRRYQSINGLAVDGIAGPETLTSLGISGGSGGDGSGSPNTLRRGDQGEAVRILQQALVDNNFYPDINAANNGVDGHFGAKTEDAVRRFQTINGLQVDGIAGPATLSALGISGGGGETPEPPEDGSTEPPGGGNIGDLKITQRFIPRSNYNRPGYGMNPDYITIHETANTAPGATAFMHASYVRNSSTQVSWHFTVDDQNVIYQHLPLNESGFHAGDGSGDGNRNSIGIELCVNSGGNFAQTRRNAAALVRQLMADYNIPIENVVTHNHWSGKLCPANLLNIFEEFKEQVMNSTVHDDGNPGELPEDGGVIEYGTFKYTSPFIDLESEHRMREEGATFGFNVVADVELGPVSGEMSVKIGFGDPDDSLFDVGETWRLTENELGTEITAAITDIAEFFGVPGSSEYNQARDTLNDILSENVNDIVEVRLLPPSNPQFSSSWPFFTFDLFTIEVMRKLEDDGVFVIEKMVIQDVDWDNNDNFKTYATVVVLVLLAAILLKGGWLAVSIGNVLRQIAGWLGRNLPGIPGLI